MHLSDLISEFGRKRGALFRLNASQIATFRINNEYLVSLEESIDGSAIFIYAAIAYAPRGKEGDGLRLQALSANLFGRETGRSTIGYDSNTESLVLFTRLDKDTVDLKLFEDELEHFVSYLSYWHTKTLNRSEGSRERAYEKFKLEQNLG